MRIMMVTNEMKVIQVVIVMIVKILTSAEQDRPGDEEDDVDGDGPDLPALYCVHHHHAVPGGGEGVWGGGGGGVAKALLT